MTQRITKLIKLLPVYCCTTAPSTISYLLQYLTHGHIPTAHIILYHAYDNAVQVFAKDVRVSLAYPQVPVVRRFFTGLHV